MRAGPLKTNDFFPNVNAVYQNPIGLHVAVPAAYVAADQLMIPVSWLKWLSLEQQSDDIFELLLILAALDHQVHVLGKLFGVLWRKQLNSKL